MAITKFKKGVFNYGNERGIQLDAPDGPKLTFQKQGSKTFNPANLVDGAGESTTVTVTGAKLGDYARESFSLDLQGITVTAYVSAADTVTVRFQNESGGALDLASGTLKVVVERFA